MTDTVIVSAVRTPIGAFQGALGGVPATRLGSVVIRAAVDRAKIAPAAVEEAIMGCVLPAGTGQAPARQAALGAGLPDTVGVLTINKVCGSGLKAVALADAAIRAGDCAVVVAGGMESMSNAPYLLPKARAGYRLGHGEILDSLVLDGLWDPYNNFHMGSAAELCAREHHWDRAAQDAFAMESYRRAQHAIAAGWFRDEIVAVEIPGRRGAAVVVDTDEEPGRFDEAKFLQLKPAFEKDGTVTVGNASSISDGAAALVVMSADAAVQHRCKPMARIVAQACASQAPEWFTTAPAAAIPLVCRKAGIKISDIDLFEINEAFACVTLHAMRACDLDPKKVNVHGGAIAMGHPIGASGARVLVTLVHALQRHNKRLGLATLCNGGGEAVAVIVERM